MKSLILGACVSHLKKETGAFSFYLRYSSVMVPAPLLRRALIEREITPPFVSFDLLRGISNLKMAGRITTSAPEEHALE
jgi:hypothetical protein